MGGQIIEHLESYGLKKLLNYLDSDPDKNIPKIIYWLEKMDREGNVQRQLRVIKKHVEDQGSNWYRLIKSLYTDIQGDIRRTIFENIIIHATVIGGQRQKKAREEFQCNIPWALLMDPTSACNIQCKGCWAADYGNALSMSYETLDGIIQQGKEIGIYMFIYSGGEPLIRKKDIISLCEHHRECAFLAFTNGTLIDEDFAHSMLRVKNFIPAISVEGFKEDTDFRRGEGVFQATLDAMKILKNHHLPFGISTCYTSRNAHVIGSEEYFDLMVDQGAKFAWFFTYMPIGVDALPELIATSEQREFMLHQIRKFRRTKPIFTIDFWNDGEYVDGCIAGGRKYLHINANGDIEPCAFIHYSDSNIYDHTLVEALQRPLFMQYRKHQPFNSNHLRPCPLLDNIGALAGMVEESKAVSTDIKDPEDVYDLTAKCKEAAEGWERKADELWNRETNKTF